MKSPYPFENVPINRISGGRWSLHQDLSVAHAPTLISSIKRYGLFRPPVVRQTDSAEFELICGHSRVALYRRFFDNDTLICKVIPFKESVPDLLRLVTEDQLLSGPLSTIMTARLMSLCKAQLPKQQVINFMTDAGINPSRSRRFLPLLELEPELRNAIHLGLISEKTGLDFVSMNPADRKFLLDLVTRFGLNANKQKQLVEFSRIITAATLQPFSETFTSKFRDLLDFTEENNMPQKSAILMRKLYEMSHPFYTRAENDFKQRVKVLKLPKNFSVHHSPSFERDGVTLEIELENIDQLERRLEKFRALLS